MSRVATQKLFRE